MNEAAAFSTGFCMIVSIVAAGIAVGAALLVADLRKCVERIHAEILETRRKQIRNLNDRARSIK